MRHASTVLQHDSGLDIMAVTLRASSAPENNPDTTRCRGFLMPTRLVTGQGSADTEQAGDGSHPPRYRGATPRPRTEPTHAGGLDPGQDTPGLKGRRAPAQANAEVHGRGPSHRLSASTIT